MTDQPMISVVMPVRNERKTLVALLDSLVSQDYPADCFEILVADGRSDDGTAELVTEYGRTSRVPVILVDNSGVRSSAGRNAGVRKARGNFIVFIDGHCHIPSSTLLRDTVRIFDKTHADCLCRPQPLVAPTSSTMGKVIATVRASTLGHGRDSLIYDLDYSGVVDPASSGASYRRSVFECVGFYDESFDACEDVEFNTRVRKAGLTAYTDPALAVYYEPRHTLKLLFLQMLRYGRGRVRLAIKNPDGISISQFAPLALLLFVVAAMAAVVLASMFSISHWMLLLSCSPALLYFSLVIASTVVLLRKHGLRYLWCAPAVYLAIHLGLGWGMFLEIARQSGRWITSTQGNWQNNQAG